jgi:3-dehydroquinate dehydratase type I
MICISIGDTHQVDAVNRLKPDLAEVRLDLMEESAGMLIPMIDPAVRVIGTCRPGGTKRKPADALASAIELGVAYVDLEFDMEPKERNELLRQATHHRVEVIISWHDFKGTPGYPRLKEILEGCYQKGADVAKIAAMVRQPSDAANLLSLYALDGRKVVLGMGDKGRITRLAAETLGAEFTFAAVGRGQATAPGQPTYEEIVSFKKILNRT